MMICSYSEVSTQRAILTDLEPKLISQPTNENLESRKIAKKSSFFSTWSRREDKSKISSVLPEVSGF